VGFALVFLIAALSTVAGPLFRGHTSEPQLVAFKAWLDQTHPKYGCDEGPGRFQNPTVEKGVHQAGASTMCSPTRAAFSQPFPNSLTMVADGRRAGTRATRP
jgi:hypothetical protein